MQPPHIPVFQGRQLLWEKPVLHLSGKFHFLRYAALHLDPLSYFFAQPNRSPARRPLGYATAASRCLSSLE